MFFPGNLPYERTQQQYNVHFLCTSNEATSVEMAQGVADQLNTHCGEGFVAFDAQSREEVFVIVCFVMVIADNPMANSLSSLMGTAANHPCRKCKADSRMKDAESLTRWCQVSTGFGLEVEFFGHRLILETL